MDTSFSRPCSLQPGTPFAGSPRWGWLIAVLLLALVAAAFACWPSSRSAARSLNDLRLVGPRGPICVRILIADDVSGSMTEFASARNAAVEEMRRWAGRNLRPDDQIGVLEFAVNAGWQSGPTSPPPSPPASVVHDGIDTYLDPVLQLVHALPASSCDTALVLVSDAQLADLPADRVDGRRALEAARVHDLFLLVPGQSIDVPAAWIAAFPEAAPQRFDGNDAGATGLAFGRVVAALTRQQLQHV